MELTAILALAAGAAWASGVNVYAMVLVLGILGSGGYVSLPPDLQILTHPLVITAAGFMYCVEFFADKTPGIDTAWDALHTFIRIPAGAAVAASALGEMDPAVQIAALIIGGGLAATSHATKAGSRVLINASPEPVSNWVASISEDLLVIAALWTALNHPMVFFALLGVFILLVIWLLPKLWRALKSLFANIKRFFGGDELESVPETRQDASPKPEELPNAIQALEGIAKSNH